MAGVLSVAQYGPFSMKAELPLSRDCGFRLTQREALTVLDGLEEAGLRAGTSALLSVRRSQEEETGTSGVRGRPPQQRGGPPAGPS